MESVLIGDDCAALHRRGRLTVGIGHHHALHQLGAVVAMPERGPK